MELVVENDSCVYKYLKWKLLKRWQTYVALLAVIMPQTIFIFEWHHGQSFRLLLLHNVVAYKNEMAKVMHKHSLDLLFKTVCMFLFLHVITVIWCLTSCTYKDYTFSPPPPEMGSYIDYTQWTGARNRTTGCVFMMNYVLPNNTEVNVFVKAKSWTYDYLFALAYILTNIAEYADDHITYVFEENVMYVKAIYSYIFLAIEIWIMSSAITATYEKLRAKYYYDYKMSMLRKYLLNNKITGYLLTFMSNFSERNWARMQGIQLPRIIYEAPICVQQDVFSALYMHNFRTPILFQDIPDYFMRQVVVNFSRKVIFPGTWIIKQGEIRSLMYFVHEGEVEKWYTDSEGNDRLAAVLTTNGFFGIVPGLFVNTPYLFSYKSRTIVDLIYLRFKKWQHILNGYPEIKYELYTAARKIDRNRDRQT